MHCGRNVGGSIPLPIISADFAQSLQAPSLRQQLSIRFQDFGKSAQSESYSKIILKSCSRDHEKEN